MEANGRQYGIDIARLASMFMVVLLHNLLQGGVLDWTLDSMRDLLYMTLENCSIIAVNIFALISGYLGVGRKVHVRKLSGLWAAAFTWSAGMAIVGLIKGTQIGLWFYRSFFPVLANDYWYFNSFLALQLLVPLLNAGISVVGNAATLLLSLGLLCLSSLLGFPTGLGINNGYSAFWLVVLWLVGAAMRLNWDAVNRYLSTKRLLLGLALIPLLSTYLEWSYVVGGLDPRQWIEYVSPLVVIQSLCFFVLAARINITNNAVRRVLARASASAFGVYLIDNSYWVYSFWLDARFSWVLEIRPWTGLPMIIGISLGMYFLFLGLETIRRALFKKALQLIGTMNGSTNAVQA